MKIHACRTGLTMALVMATLFCTHAQTDTMQRDVHRLRYKLVDPGTFGGPASADFAAPVIIAADHKVMSGASTKTTLPSEVPSERL
jgi:hypothetical protein